MTLKHLLLGLTLFGLCGCVSNEPVWARVDGRSVKDDPALARQGEIDMLICQGVVQRAALSSSPQDASDYIAEAEALNDIQRGCMAERGYLRVPQS